MCQIAVKFASSVTREDLSPLNELIHRAVLEAGVWILQTQEVQHLRKALMQLAVDKDWAILSLQDSRENLSRFFQKHTQD